MIGLGSLQPVAYSSGKFISGLFDFSDHDFEMSFDITNTNTLAGDMALEIFLSQF